MRKQIKETVGAGGIIELCLVVDFSRSSTFANQTSTAEGRPIWQAGIERNAFSTSAAVAALARFPIDARFTGDRSAGHRTSACACNKI